MPVCRLSHTGKGMVMTYQHDNGMYCDFRLVYVITELPVTKAIGFDMVSYFPCRERVLVIYSDEINIFFKFPGFVLFLSRFCHLHRTLIET